MAEIEGNPTLNPIPIPTIFENINLSYSAEEIDAAIEKITNLISIVSGDIIQLYNDSKPVYPLTRVEAIIDESGTNLSLILKRLTPERVESEEEMQRKIETGDYDPFQIYYVEEKD